MNEKSGIDLGIERALAELAELAELAAEEAAEAAAAEAEAAARQAVVAKLERVDNVSPLAAAQLAAEKYFENRPSLVLESATEVGAEHIKNFKLTEETPTAGQIIELIAQYYQKDVDTVVSWLKSINWAEYKQ